MNYKKKLADSKQAMEIPFWKSSCKTPSKISSFRTLKLDKIVNITFHLQLINQSVKNLLWRIQKTKKMGSQSLFHRKNFQCTWNAFWTMSTLVQSSSGKKREIFWLFKVRKSSGQTDHNPHFTEMKSQEKDVLRKGWQGCEQ